jgi:hypothetical protein
MQVKIYSVQDGGRNWQQWLGETVMTEPTSENFFEERWYEEQGRFLVIIHLGAVLTDDDEGTKVARGFEAIWRKLPDDRRERVWWLFYSGSGYRHVRSEKAQIHFLRYLVGEALHTEELACFKAFLDELKSGKDLNPSEVWSTLYPTGNMMAATLLAILSAAENVDIRPAIQDLLVQETDLRQAYQESESREHRSRGSSSLSYENWKMMLRQERYKDVRDQLIAALGAVPD